MTAPDETASSSTSTLTGRPLEESEADAAAVDIVPETETAAQMMTGAATVAAAALSDGATVARRKCRPKEKVAADADDSIEDQLDDNTTTSEAMISPTTKVQSPVSLYRPFYSPEYSLNNDYSTNNNNSSSKGKCGLQQHYGHRIRCRCKHLH